MGVCVWETECCGGGVQRYAETAQDGGGQAAAVGSGCGPRLNLGLKQELWQLRTSPSLLAAFCLIKKASGFFSPC